MLSTASTVYAELVKLALPFLKSNMICLHSRGQSVEWNITDFLFQVEEWNLCMTVHDISLVLGTPIQGTLRCRREYGKVAVASRSRTRRWVVFAPQMARMSVCSTSIIHGWGRHTVTLPSEKPINVAYKTLWEQCFGVLTGSFKTSR